MRTFLSLLTFCIAAVVAGCSILKKEDPENEVRMFLTRFQSSLTKTDEEILTSFRARQSREAILSVVQILQNKDPFIVCNAAIADGRITLSNEHAQVDIPVTFSVKDLDSKDSRTDTLTLWLTRRDTAFEITDLNGEKFYQTFTAIKNRNAWLADQKLALQERTWIYENAHALEAKFDSVIWYATTGTTNYFYVVKGNWQNNFLNYSTRKQSKPDVRMGLVDATGNIIIPLEYDLIGTISFSRGDLVEVIKDGKAGLFNIETRQLVVEPAYNFIIPKYSGNNVWAIVKRDTTYGWLDRSFVYTEGFPSKNIEEWITNFEFLKEPVQLKAGQYIFCEIPSPDYAGSGIIIPPAYFSKHGIFDEIEGGISTTKVPINGWTEYKETQSSFLEKISDNLRAVVTTIRERYLEGREEFYTSNTVMFVNNQQDTLKVASVSGTSVSIRSIGNTLLEVRAPHDYWFGEYEASGEGNLEEHTYFSLENNKIVALTSTRLYAQTQFVKLDSFYLTGKFRVYNSQSEQEEFRNFLSVTTITYMRDEILAANGYKFPDPERTKQLQSNSNAYSPQYTSLEEVTGKMTEIDKHNLAFLNKILSLLEAKPV